MGIRVVSVFLIGIMLSSCSTSKDNSAVGWSKEKDYVKFFKTSVLCGCLNEISNDEFGQSLYFEYNDIGLYSEVAILGHDVSKKAQMIGKNFIRKLHPVQMPDVEGRKNGFSACIHFVFYEKTIDSIAKKQYKIAKKAELDYIYE